VTRSFGPKLAQNEFLKFLPNEIMFQNIAIISIESGRNLGVFIYTGGFWASLTNKNFGQD
jgi:hypothetical protein